MTMHDRQQGNWASIQHLRGIAAVLVVFFHARNPHDGLFNPLTEMRFPAHGVDIFFVISGFIMFIAARKEPFAEFWRRRIIRIVPLYWLAMAATLTMDFWKLGGTAATVPAMIQSALFIPHYHPRFTTEIWPYVIPGWTLQYEMFFYLLFSLTLGRRRPLLLLCLLIGGCLLGGLFESDKAIVRAYTDLRLIEFLAGVTIGRLASGEGLSKAAWILPVGVVAFVFSDALPLQESIRFAPASILIVLGAVAAEQRGWSPRLPLLSAIGGSSYALYLFHPIILWLVIDAYMLLPLTGWPQLIGFLTLAMAASVIGGYLIHIYVERPLLQWLRTSSATRMAKRRRPAVSAA